MTGEAVARLDMQALGIQEMPTLREGIEFRFYGSKPGEDDEPGEEFGDVTLTVPPLNFSGIKRLQSRLADLAKVDSKALETIIDATVMALKRNYRGVPRWLIEQTIDIGNMPEYTRAFMDVSGIRRKEIEEGKAAAAQAVAAQKTPAPPSTGTDSTAT